MRSFNYTRRGDVITYRAERIDATWWRVAWTECNRKRSARYADAAITAYVESGTWKVLTSRLPKGRVQP